MMILLQQRKIAALDEANNRLLSELSRLGDRVGYSRAGVQASKRSERERRYLILKCLFNFCSRSVQETPKTVDELLDTLDSFSDTRVWEFILRTKNPLDLTLPVKSWKVPLKSLVDSWLLTSDKNIVLMFFYLLFKHVIFLFPYLMYVLCFK